MGKKRAAFMAGQAATLETIGRRAKNLYWRLAEAGHDLEAGDIEAVMTVVNGVASNLRTEAEAEIERGREWNREQKARSANPMREQTYREHPGLRPPLEQTTRKD